MQTKLLSKVTEIEHKLISSHHNQRLNEETLAVSAIRSNPKYFYKYVKSKSKIKASIGPLTNDDGSIIADPLSICEAFKLQFENVFSIPDKDKTIPEPCTFFSAEAQTDVFLDNIQFDQHDIEDAIKKLTPNLAAGPDNFPAILLKSCARELSLPILLLWKASMSAGVIPNLLRKALITPIFKSGSRGLAKNYRPIALTSHIIKIFEKIMVRQLTNFLESNNLINHNQHGFRTGRASVSQLLSHYNRILTSLEKNKSTEVIYLDFAKAFDKVDHGIVLHKLRALGITGRLAIWIHSFLHERKQIISVNGTLSPESSVISGVPQGSVLGPILFIILINDINRDIAHSEVSSFADDTRVSKEIHTIQDSELLQSDLEKIYQWANSNNLCFNSSKFERICYTSNNPIPEYSYTTEDGSEIKKTAHLRDLGVIMSDSATFAEHIYTIAASGRNQLGWILRTFQSRDKSLLLTLWKSLVVPILEYCCQVWSPWQLGEIQALEAIQRTCTAKIAEVSHLDYWERLKYLNLYSLERRRERYIIIYIWKIINKLVPNLSTDPSTAITTKEHPRHGITCIIRNIPRTAPARISSISSASLSVRGCKLFNCLPKLVRGIKDSTVDHFKKHLDSFLKKIPDQPCLPHYYKMARSNCLIHQLEVISALQSRGGAPA